MKDSYFDGGILDYIGYSILVAIICRTYLWDCNTLGGLHDAKLEDQTYGSGWSTSIL